MHAQISKLDFTGTNVYAEIDTLSTHLKNR
jgi:hypothetical protein